MKSHMKKCKKNILRVTHAHSGKRGFTLLMASLVAAIFLAIAISLVSITIKQIILNSTVRESERAFFAADSGIECALYWDLKGERADGSNKPVFGVGPPHDIECNNNTPFTVGPPGQNEFIINFPTGECATVKVVKNSADGTATTTTITSKGHNTCDTSDDRRVERGILTEYEI